MRDMNLLACDLCKRAIPLNEASACAGPCRRVVCDSHLKPTPPPHGLGMCDQCRRRQPAAMREAASRRGLDH